MPRLPADLIARIKRAIPCERLLEARGYRLERSGADLLCRCPFPEHDDRTPSFRVSEKDGASLWHCLGQCAQGGDVIRLAQKLDGSGFIEAVAGLAALAGIAFDAGKYTGARLAAGAAPATCPVAVDATGSALARQVVDDYHAQLLRPGNACLDYLAARGLDDRRLIDHFRLGFSMRGSLGRRLPAKTRQAGALVRAELEQQGWFKAGTGHEFFAGSVVVPLLDADGSVAGCYGRKISDKLRAGTPRHLYLPGPRRVVWNACDCVNEDGAVVLCESLIDALTLWRHGITETTCAYGTNGFTAAHLDLFQARGVRTVCIAYDNDAAGNQAAVRLAEELRGHGMTALRMELPSGMDVNAWACCLSADAAAALHEAVAGAQWLGAPVARPVPSTAAAPAVDGADPEAASDSSSASPDARPVVGRPVAQAVELRAVGDDFFCDLPERAYRIRCFQKNTTVGRIQVQLRLSAGGDFHQDTVDLCAHRQRTAFATAAAAACRLGEDVIAGDLKRLLCALEARQDALIAARDAPAAPVSPAAGLSAAERDAALQALRSPTLLADIINDLRACGLVGEDANGLAAYLVATSRLLDAPLGAIIQASSSAGKSSLMNAVLRLMPATEAKNLTTMSPQVLLYVGEHDLEHRILSIAEDVGTGKAAYHLKILLSEKRLEGLTTVQNPSTGEMEARSYLVRGPVALLTTTTRDDDELDDELVNRCLLLSVSETDDQTAAVQALQRAADTIAGWQAATAQDRIQRRHGAMQALLRPLRVFNPYAPQLRFVHTQPRHRRDHLKYLALIKTIALLHQYCRPLREAESDGERIAYIDVEPSDIAAANRIAAVVLGRTLERVPRKTRDLLRVIDRHVGQRAAAAKTSRDAVRFTRRELRALWPFSDTALRKHLDRLAELELVSMYTGDGVRSYRYGMPYTYDADTEDRVVLDLIDPAQLVDPCTYDAQVAPLQREVAPRKHPDRTPIAPHVHPGEINAKTVDNDLLAVSV
ncbi:MAG: toprim domain-containing protein [Rhodosalinus sp.]